MSPWRISCDGTALPHSHGGRMGVGAVLEAPDGAVHELSRDTGQRGCNNEAEALALIAALEVAQSLAAKDLVITCDSDVVVSELAGKRAPTRVPRLAVLFDRARALLAAFDRAELRLVPRRRISGADALARAALGLKPKPNS